VRKNSQDVGLEAAIIERVRNSSLVECTGTDNVARLKHRTEAVDPVCRPRWPPSLRKENGCASLEPGDEMVGERSLGREARPQGRVERREERMPE
jgi:hypothetical protein